MRLLLVEDDRMIADALLKGLSDMPCRWTGYPMERLLGGRCLGRVRGHHPRSWPAAAGWMNVLEHLRKAGKDVQY